MEGWQQEWLKMLDQMSEEVDKFFQDLTKEMDKAADAFVEFSEDVAEQLYGAMVPPIDRFDDQLDEWLEPVLQVVLQIEATFAEATQPISQTIDPVMNEHPVCMGCRHYHGQTYSGTMLVCAMHPYGVEGQDSCPDKESVSWGFPTTSHDFDDDF